MSQMGEETNAHPGDLDLNDDSMNESWQDISTPSTQTMQEVEPDEPKTHSPEERRRPTTDDCEEFHKAIIRGDLETIKAKLALGVDVELKTRDGYTALVISIMETQVDITRLLLERGADVHHRVQTLPPIVHAVMKTERAPQLIQLLMDHGANPSTISGPDRMNALHWAAVDGFADAVDFLVSKDMHLNSTCSKGRTPLILAAEQGYTTVAKVLLAKGAELFKRSHNGGTALAWAACNGHLDTVKYLLEEGIDVDDCDNYGLTALLLASNTGHLDVVEFLISKGADVNRLSVKPKNHTPAMAAAMAGHAKVLQALIRSGADLNIPNGSGETVLGNAMAEGRLEAVQVLLEALGGPNHPRDSVALRMAMANSDTTIHSLIATASMMYPHFILGPEAPGKFAWMSWVLESGGHLVKSKAMSNMMHAAFRKEQYDMVEVLLGHGCDPNTFLPTGHTPLSVAIGRRKLEVVRMLLDAGADPAKQGRERGRLCYTPLHQALLAREDDREKDTSIIDLLITSSRCNLLQGKRFQSTAFSYILRQFDVGAHGVAENLAFRMIETVPDIKQDRSDDGSTLIHVAVHYGHRDLIDFLLLRGADINVTDQLGQTPFLRQCQRSAKDLPFLLTCGADVFAKDKQGQSGLHVAAFHGRIDTLKLLLSKGLDIDAVTLNGDTPLLCALVAGQEEAALYLMSQGADTRVKCLTIARRNVVHNAASPGIESSSEPERVNTTAEESKGWTPLALACRMGSRKLVDTLISAGADTEAMSENGDRPLHISLITRNEDIALLLLTQHNVSATATCSLNRTPLHLAVEYCNPRTARFLLEHRGVSTEDCDDESWTPLCVCDDPGITRLLVEHGANVNHVDVNGWTALHQAVSCGSVDTFRILLRAGAQLTARTKDDALSVGERIDGLANARVRQRLLDVVYEEAGGRRRWN